MDVNTDFGGGYRPRNFNLSQNGPVSMRKALAGSLNIPAVKTLALVGVENVTKTVRDVGITSKLENCGLSLVLGGCEVKLVDHVNGYATLAAGGIRHDKTAILKVLAQDGQVLEEYQDKPQTVLDPQAVYLLTNIMSDNTARSYVFGSNSPLTLGNRPVAAKTGTTQDFRDGWTVGFTPSLVAGVWAGNNNNFRNTGLMKQDAVVTAGPIWNAFMRAALKDTPIEQFTEPAGITKVTVDSVSGKLPTVNTPETKTEIFADYSVPTAYDDVHVVARINILTGQPADDSTPPELIKEVPYTVFHSERRDYAPWEQAVIAWALANGYNYPPGTDTTGDVPSDTLRFNQPSDGDIIKTIPFTIGVAAPSDTTKVDISLNNELLQSLTNRPFSLLFARPLSNGTYTLKATAYLKSGKTQTATATITINTENTLSITSPVDSTLQTGDTITARSNNKLDTEVQFFLQRGNRITSLGTTNDSSNTNEGFTYSLTLSNKLSPGTYQLYAKSGNLTSDKISVTIK
jgi:membrane peptidoglycan carboxypeptidase